MLDDANSTIDDELYNRFITEVRRNIESTNNIGRSNSTNPTINSFSSSTGGDSNGTNNNNNNNNYSRNSHGDIYARLLRSLLYIDYIFMLITLPMTLYTIFNLAINLVTFDFNNSDNVENVIGNEDIFHKLQIYFKYVKVEEDMMSTTTSNNKGKFEEILFFMYNKLFSKIKTINFESMTTNTNKLNSKPSEIDLIDTLGLLGKFHKIIRYYTTPLENLKFYPSLIKSLTTIIFLLYGFIGSSYVILLNMFFILCLILTLIRKYQDVAEIIIKQFW